MPKASGEWEASSIPRGTDVQIIRALICVLLRSVWLNFSQHRILDLLICADALKKPADIPPVIYKLHHFITHASGGEMITGRGSVENTAIIKGLSQLARGEDAPMNTRPEYGTQELEWF